MIPARVIEAKRDGDNVDAALLSGFLEGHLRGEVPDYQMAAFLMAAYLNGLDDAETEVFVPMISGRGLAHAGDVTGTVSAVPLHRRKHHEQEAR
jgi:thymidine phosphorylase